MSYKVGAIHIPIFFRWECWGTKKSDILSKVAQLIASKGGNFLVLQVNSLPSEMGSHFAAVNAGTSLPVITMLC